MERLFWYKLMIIPNASLSYWCHLYFLGIAFICTWNLSCLELEDLSCCSRISKHTIALAVTRMKECFIFIYHKYFSFKKRWNERWQKELGSGRWRPWVSWKQKAINLFSIALLFPNLCHIYVMPNHTSVAACSISTVCLNICLNLMCFQSRPPQLQVNSSQIAFWKLPSQCYMGRLRSPRSH